MKKIIAFLFFLSLFSSDICLSQFGWYWCYPKPVGSHLEDVFFNNSNIGYAVGWDGVIMKTTNAGINWDQLNSEGNHFLTSVFFLNDNTGFVVSGDNNSGTKILGNLLSPVNNFLFKTTNAGLNWAQIYTFNNTYLSSVKFINDSLGFVVGGNYMEGGIPGGRIYKTTNSGINWDQYYPTPTINQLFSIFFTSVNVGYVVGDDGRILKTTDSGVNWFSLNLGGDYTKLNSIFFTNSYTGFIVGGGGKLYKTSNEGLNWHTISTGINDELRDIEFKDNYTGYISAGGNFVQTNGKILKTTNGGNSWSIMNINNTQNYRRLSVYGNNVTAVGYWGTIVKTSDDGVNWNNISNSVLISSINDINIFDSLKCIAVGDSSKIYLTNDGGKTWQSSYLGGNNQLLSIKFVNSSTGYISGGYSTYSPPFYYNYYSKIYKSTDSGITWYLVYGINSETGIMYDIKFLTPMLGYCVGGGNSQFGTTGKILKTTNEGVSWISKNYGSNECIYSVSILDSFTALACGTNGKIFKTSNGGENFNSLNTGITTTLISMDFPNSITGFVATYNQIIKTTNGGLNWVTSSSNVPYSFDINKIKFLNVEFGFAVGVSFPEQGRAGDIIRTTNGGLNWEHISSTSQYPSIQRRGLNGINFLNTKIGYIVGERSTILKTTNGGNIYIGINTSTSNTPTSPSLSQNYPNPFNPVTKIKYDIPPSKGARGMTVQLIIYDVLGREIETLVNESQKPGSYEVTWDGSRYASGVYFYRLFIDDASAPLSVTKKMVLIK